MEIGPDKRGMGKADECHPQRSCDGLCQRQDQLAVQAPAALPEVGSAGLWMAVYMLASVVRAAWVSVIATSVMFPQAGESNL
jgi:hypothetical protein